MKEIAIVVSSPMTIDAFLKKQIIMLSAKYKVTLIANFSDRDFKFNFPDTVDFYSVKIERKIFVIKDIAALFQLFRYFRKRKFLIVHSVTPKAGLLTMYAAFVVGVRYRVHTFTGQVWATRKGLARFVLKTLDKTIALLATHVLVDSESQRCFLLSNHILQAKNSSVLCDGSISGVDLLRFKPDSARKAAVRRDLGVEDDDIVVLFLGRINLEKGVIELAGAFEALSKQYDFLKLLIVGPDEGNLKNMLLEIAGEFRDRIIFIDYTSTPEFYMQASDIFCLPSYREGFGSVIIEAAACGLPSVGSDIYGISDAISQGETGLLCEPKDIGDLSQSLQKLICDKNYRDELGSKALLRASEKFSDLRLSQAIVDYYHHIEHEGNF